MNKFLPFFFLSLLHCSSVPARSVQRAAVLSLSHAVVLASEVCLLKTKELAVVDKKKAIQMGEKCSRALIDAETSSIAAARAIETESAFCYVQATANALSVILEVVPEEKTLQDVVIFSKEVGAYCNE